MISVIFIDLVNSTSLAEQLDAEVLAAVMARYFAAMRQEIEEAGGRVEKFIGDAVMGCFGLPVAHEDDASRVLRAALGVRRRLPRLNEELEPRFGIRLQVHTGINTGQVVTAQVRTAEELGMVTGDVLNVAARLEASSAPGQIVAAARTVQAVRGFVFHPLGSLALKGRADPVYSFELLREDPAADTVGIPFMAPLVGREHEIALLQALHERVAATGLCHVLVVHGEVGLGSTRLVRELGRWARALADPPTVLEGRFVAYGPAGAHRGLAEILMQRTGVLPSDGPAAALAKIAATLSALLRAPVDADDGRQMAEVLAASAGLISLSELSTMPAGRFVQLSREAWKTYLEGMAMQHPTIVALDDLQHADDFVLDLLEHLARTVSGPLLLAAVTRSELFDRRPSWPQGVRNALLVGLEPLPATDAARLLGLLLPSEDPETGLLVEVVARCGGNPFFLEELLRHLAAEGCIVQNESGWAVDSAVSNLGLIPDSVEDVLEARLDRVPAEQRRALQLASVAGHVFWDDLLVRLGDALGGLPAEPDAVRVVVNDLEDHHLVVGRQSAVAGAREYGFRQNLIADVAYRMLARGERGAAHEIVARWLESAVWSNSQDVLGLVAHHWSRALEDARRDPAAAAPRLEELRRRAFASHVEAARRAAGRGHRVSAQRLAATAVELASTPTEREAAVSSDAGIPMR